jgi:hypothetical protein
MAVKIIAKLLLCLPRFPGHLGIELLPRLFDHRFVGLKVANAEGRLELYVAWRLPLRENAWATHGARNCDGDAHEAQNPTPQSVGMGAFLTAFPSLGYSAMARRFFRG